MCEIFGITRDGYYKMRKRMNEELEREKQIVALVKEQRKELPRSGARKMFYKLKDVFLEKGLFVGRDRFFSIMQKYNLLVKKRKDKVPCTTYSNHDYAVAPNLYKDLEVSAPGEAIVADITYLRVNDKFSYLFLATDAYSRKIVGWTLRKDLKHEGALETVGQLTKNYSTVAGIVHHTDRGSQYCCHEFLVQLKKHGIKSSMTDSSHCAQNAKAERVNGILKDEFYLDKVFHSHEQAEKAARNAILMYNAKRPHLSLDYQTPDEVHFADLGCSKVA